VRWGRVDDTGIGGRILLRRIKFVIFNGCGMMMTIDDVQKFIMIDARRTFLDFRFILPFRPFFFTSLCEGISF